MCYKFVRTRAGHLTVRLSRSWLPQIMCAPTRIFSHHLLGFVWLIYYANITFNIFKSFLPSFRQILFCWQNQVVAEGAASMSTKNSRPELVWKCSGCLSDNDMLSPIFPQCRFGHNRCGKSPHAFRMRRT